MRKIALLLVLIALLSTTLVVSAADPTADPACPGSLIPQLAPGMTGHINRIFSTLRYTPDGAVKQVILAPGTFSAQTEEQTFGDTGLHQPTCVNGVWSWYIQYMDIESNPYGWASESQVVSIWGLNQYWLVPGEIPVPEEPVTPTTCDTAPAFRLTPGGQGQIADVFSTLRSAPGASGTVINAPATFNVLPADVVPAGYTQPTCAGGIAFWYIQYTDVTGNPIGWASEGNYDTYWLEPVVAPAAG